MENYLDELESILKAIKNCTSKETVLRLGQGSVWIFRTGGWAKNDDFVDESIYEQIKFQSRPNNRNYRDYFFPKTRRMDEEGELLGFVKLSLEG